MMLTIYTEYHGSRAFYTLYKKSTVLVRHNQQQHSESANSAKATAVSPPGVWQYIV